MLSPPLAKIAKNGIIRALLNYFIPFCKQNMSEDYTKGGELLGATAKDELWSGVEGLCLCRRLHFPFNTPMTCFKIYLKAH
jgi:hypothetical protein